MHQEQPTASIGGRGFADTDTVLVGYDIDETLSRSALQGMSRVLRRRHVLILGRIGSGKTTLLTNLAKQDIDREGMCCIDGFGRQAAELLQAVPRSRVQGHSAYYWAPGIDTDRPWAWNLFDGVTAENRDQVAQDVYDMLRHMFWDGWGFQTGNIARESCKALCEVMSRPHFPPQTVLGVYLMVSHDGYRQWILSHVRNPDIIRYWKTQFGGWNATQRADRVAPLQNKLGLLKQPPLESILGQAKSTFHPAVFLERRLALIVNLDKLGTEVKDLFKHLLSTAFLRAALRRETPVGEEAPDFFIYLDDAHQFLRAPLVSSLGEAREGRVNFTFAAPSPGSFRDGLVRETILDSVGTTLAFRVSGRSAQQLFDQTGTLAARERDFSGLLPFEIAAQFPETFEPETFTAFPPLPIDYGYGAQIMADSQRTFGRPRARVEGALRRFSQRWTG